MEKVKIFGIFDISREIGVKSTPDFSLMKMRTCPPNPANTVDLS